MRSLLPKMRLAPPFASDANRVGSVRLNALLVPDERRGRRHDRVHVAFSVVLGDPFRFYRGLLLLGGLQIDAMELATAVSP